jgi:hypothetical protein
MIDAVRWCKMCVVAAIQLEYPLTQSHPASYGARNDANAALAMCEQKQGIVVK